VRIEQRNSTTDQTIDDHGGRRDPQDLGAVEARDRRATADDAIDGAALGIIRRRRGVGETRQTAFRVPLRSIGYWTQRFIEKGIPHQTVEKRFDQSVLPFTDQDEMGLALVGIADAENEPGWSNGDIPSEHAIRGLQGVTLLLDSAQKTAAILTDVFGFREVAREGSVIRFAGAGDAKGSVVDIYEAAGVLRGHQGRGSVHHTTYSRRR